MLEIVPMTLREANAFVEQNHRHHGPVAGHKFSIGLSDGEQIVGVAIIGRPVSRHLDDGWTMEVNRLCTDGSRNACSILYAAAWRAARAMGYKRLVTYILESENGASLRAAGWKCVGQAGGPAGRSRRAGAVAAAGPGLCERDRGGAGAVPLHGVGEKQLLAVSVLPLLRTGGGSEKIRRRKIAVWLDCGRGGGIRHP